MTEITFIFQCRGGGGGSETVRVANKELKNYKL